MEIKISIEDLKQFVLNNLNGFTIGLNLKPIEFKKGYCVSITNNSKADLNQAITELIRLSQAEPFKNIEPLFIGGWKDIKENLFYLDLTLIIKNKKIALSIAKLFNQKAIFNLSNFESIYL
jgi:hypothetical protein